MTDDYRIETIAELETIIGEPLEFLKEKVLAVLDDTMKTFIARSPLAFISTLDSEGRIDTSPKGDPSGFIQIDDQGCLLIPERPGNRLTFGFRNLLGNSQIGLIFVLPNERETLRVKGIATLHSDPKQLEAMAVKDKPALLYTRVEVTECFFHCGKAMIRSKLWQPDSWAETGPNAMVEQLNKVMGGDEELEQVIGAEIEKNYREELY
ncbi:MAG: PPOX class probable FMN-dependent enzyme [Bacteroidia bacterium]|jgi:PPOX class probable FMN-dependent enzyme